MTAEFATPGPSPLPGTPLPYVLEAGEGERAHLFDQLFTVLLSGDETDGQFGVFTMEAPKGRAIPVHSHTGVHEIFYVLDGKVRVVVEDGDGGTLDEVLTTGDFGYVPAGHRHTFRVESHRARTLGVNTGGFERFFGAAGERTASRMPPARPVVPSPEQLGEAARAYRNEFHLDAHLLD
ncbi:quercetin 2,3-dioxygenase [Actinomycetospora sp. TBRC 11914]|uniref:quercetin 2,3-dioxygenase n=1 Tax=Actinomycetospora sp. TBRC 11914 TaxID=2729387 RepID=UPI00145DAB8A|nr:quercetin 2,3-dioxygenase [Actinomycetospora sp. TBRC 11914]NMO88508.1 cupin domain-containing protein [Actinomycetospora sp. TBRC 11914]